jgi:hypothetical protein
MKNDETPLPWSENYQARLVLKRLREGPASTADLQKPPIIHVARQIWELRHWYGFQIKTGRLPNNLAVYYLEGVVEKPPPQPTQPKLVFGQHRLCTNCHGKGVLRGDPCRICDGTGYNER